MIDLRSDTVTKPTPGMLHAMFSADVGDDVFVEDPTVNKLEKMTADIFGVEAGLFCPSGTMTNQIAIKCHTQPGNEVICEKMSHIYIYEAGGVAFNSGCQVKVIEGDRGRINATQVAEATNSNDIHRPRSKVVSLENSTNRGGGCCYEFNEVQQIKEICLVNDIKLHLDGARLFNALVATHQTSKSYGEIFDSISVCLSKGLGAPVGSVLLGSKEFIKNARRIRKVLGGGMRQAGYLAAAGIYALEYHIERLALDHLNAKQIADALLKKDFTGKMLPVETNIIIFEVVGSYTPKTLAEAFNKYDVLVIAISPTQIRMVLHLDITEEMVKETIQVIEDL